MLCMRLNTYGMVVGWLGSIWSFLAMILISTALEFVDEISVATASNDPNMSVSQIRIFLVIACRVFLALLAINLLTSVLLMLGTVKERHLLLLPWLINFGIISTVILLVEVIDGSVSGKFPVFSLLWWYHYYGIYSLFKHIQLSRDQQRPLIQGAPQRTGDHSSTTHPNYTKI